ncbi:unnamed protein product [Amoebophrya sp. A25]|nr:unnamed protein product [Amoebophrya sp. A25]|eukprot:GSA25T00020094001.1
MGGVVGSTSGSASNASQQVSNIVSEQFVARVGRGAKVGPDRVAGEILNVLGYPQVHEVFKPSLPNVASRERMVVCRCWLSLRFPYCDNTHQKLWRQGINVGPCMVQLEHQAVRAKKLAAINAPSSSSAGKSSILQANGGSASTASTTTATPTGRSVAEVQLAPASAGPARATPPSVPQNDAGTNVNLSQDPSSTSTENKVNNTEVVFAPEDVLKDSGEASHAPSTSTQTSVADSNTASNVVEGSSSRNGPKEFIFNSDSHVEVDESGGCCSEPPDFGSSSSDFYDNALQMMRLGSAAGLLGAAAQYMTPVD